SASRAVPAVQYRIERGWAVAAALNVDNGGFLGVAYGGSTEHRRDEDQFSSPVGDSDCVDGGHERGDPLFHAGRQRESPERNPVGYSGCADAAPGRARRGGGAIEVAGGTTERIARVHRRAGDRDESRD